MNNSNKIALQTERTSLGSEDSPTNKLAHLTGTTAFTLDSTARQELKKLSTRRDAADRGRRRVDRLRRRRGNGNRRDSS